jgi:hypothetical protein
MAAIGTTRTSHDVGPWAATRGIADIECARSESPYHSGFCTVRFIDSGGLHSVERRIAKRGRVSGANKDSAVSGDFSTFPVSTWP